MTKLYRYGNIFIIVAWFFATIGCSSNKQNIQQLKLSAEQTTTQVIAYLNAQNIDSLQLVTVQNPSVKYYIYNDLELVYWSDNSINVDSYIWTEPRVWHSQSLTNADVLARWERWGHVRVLTLIPVKWNDTDYQLLSDTFSYHPLTDSDDLDRLPPAHTALLIISLSLIMAACVALWMSYRKKYVGIIINVLSITILVSAVGLMVAAALLCSLTENDYLRHRQSALHDKCLYIQSALQNIYYWEVQFPSDLNKNAAVNVELHDLAHTYGLDINVYDMQGRLAGSSSPQIFEKGLVSTLLDPYVLFLNQLSQSDEAVVRNMSLAGNKCLVANTAFINGQNVQIGYISVPLTLSMEECNDAKNRILMRILVVYVFLMILCIWLFVYLSRQVSMPLDALGSKMSRYRFGKADNYLPVSVNNEIGKTTEQYNAMITSLDEAFHKLMRTERDSAWRTMARQIAHEINNPLTPMKLTIQQLQRTKGTERFDAYFDRSTSMLLEQMDTLSRIASSFSTFAKMPDVATTEVDIAQKLTTAIQLFADNEQHIPIRYVGANSGVMAWADKEQILEVFTNLIKNALQALEGVNDGDIIVMLQDGAEEVCITVSDNGKGIAEEIRDRIFTPNFTTKTTGTGLGLAISKNIVEGSEGRISFETSEKGTKFFVYLKKTP